ARYQEAAKMMAEFVAQQSNKLAEDALKRDDMQAAEFWGPRGVGRAALHALGGGILGGVNDVSGMIKAAFGGAASTLIAAHVKALVDDMIDKAGLGGTEAGRSLANIVSGGIVAGLTSAVGGGDAAAYATHEFRYNYLTSQQLDKAINVRKKIAQCQQTLRCNQAELDRLTRQDREYVEQSASNTRTLIENCQKAAQGAACQQGMKDAIAYGKSLEQEYRSGSASWESTAGFSSKSSIYDYDLLLYRSLVEAQASGKKPDAAIRDFLTDFARQEGRVDSLLDALGVVGGAAVCTSGAGTPACVAGILAAISSANHLSADAQKAVTGKEARTVLVAALVDRLDYTKEQAEKLQFYIDIGVIAVTVGAGGYKIAVDAKRLAKADQALVKLDSNATKGGVPNNWSRLSPAGAQVNTPKGFTTYRTPDGDIVHVSPGGLIYGPGSVHGDRVSHVLDHTTPNPNKTTHTVFNGQGDDALALIDEAWSRKGAPVSGDPGAYIVPMGRIVGTAGETNVRVVVKPGTSEIITAYPQ
ncbi:hypothetical protein CQ054_21730, partial [Ochrobactrum sp. MYb29]